VGTVTDEADFDYTGTLKYINKKNYSLEEELKTSGFMLCCKHVQASLVTERGRGHALLCLADLEVQA
jgi:hypothetical protein